MVYAQDAQDGKQVEGSGGDEVEVTSYATSAPTMSYGEMTIGVRNFFHAAFGKPLILILILHLLI